MIFQTKAIGRFICHYRTEKDFFLNGDRDFPVLVGDAVLFHKMRLSFCGFVLFEWMKPIRTVPCFEWARSAIGDTYIPDRLS